MTKWGIPWFESVTPQQRRKREEKYLRMMFPFGAAQKEREISLLKQCVKAGLKDGELLYQLLCVKEALLEEDEESRKTALANWAKSHLAGYLSPNDKRIVYALAKMGLACKSLEDFPDADALTAKAEKENLSE